MEFKVFSGRRMDESEGACMKQLTMHFYPFDLCGLTAWPVQLISDKRVVQICHVDPYLMCAPGLQLCP